MGIYNLFDQGKPQAGAGNMAGCLALDSEKAVKDMGEVFFTDADSRILDGKIGKPAVQLGADLHLSSFRGVFDGVGNNIHECGPDMIIVHIEPPVFFAGTVYDPDVFSFRLWHCNIHDVFDYFMSFDWFKIEDDRAAFQFGEIKQIFDEPQEIFGPNSDSVV